MLKRSNKTTSSRLPLQNIFLANMKWLQPSLQEYSLVNQVLLATDSLSQVITGDEKSELQEEHIDFCTSPLSSDKALRSSCLLARC